MAKSGGHRVKAIGLAGRQGWKYLQDWNRVILLHGQEFIAFTITLTVCRI
jgi:hypothetical protein